VNSLDQTVTKPLHLRRFDYSLAGGGPIWKDRIFFFGSSERITEDRGIDFLYPALGQRARPFFKYYVTRKIRSIFLSAAAKRETS